MCPSSSAAFIQADFNSAMIYETHLIKSLEQCGGLKETVQHFIIILSSFTQIYIIIKYSWHKSCFKIRQINKKCN